MAKNSTPSRDGIVGGALTVALLITLAVQNAVPPMAVSYTHLDVYKRQDHWCNKSASELEVCPPTKQNKTSRADPDLANGAEEQPTS